MNSQIKHIIQKVTRLFKQENTKALKIEVLSSRECCPSSKCKSKFFLQKVAPGLVGINSRLQVCMGSIKQADFENSLRRGCHLSNKLRAQFIPKTEILAVATAKGSEFKDKYLDIMFPYA